VQAGRVDRSNIARQVVGVVQHALRRSWAPTLSTMK
jgi:hypothetical protein